MLVEHQVVLYQCYILLWTVHIKYTTITEHFAVLCFDTTIPVNRS